MPAARPPPEPRPAAGVRWPMSSTPPPVGLIALATADAPHDLPQDQAAAVAREVFGARFPAFARMAPVFGTAGVRHRQLAMPVEWYLRPLDWPARMAAYTECAVDMFCRAAEAALA